MLQQHETEDGSLEGLGHGVSFYYVCDDADAIYHELAVKGFTLNPPVTAEYGMRQVFIPEPDGYTICFESPLAVA